MQSRIQSDLLLLLLLAASLAGCVNEADRRADTPTARIDLDAGLGCLDSNIPSCAQPKAEITAPLVLGPSIGMLRVVPYGTYDWAMPGVLVTNISRSIVIRNLDVRGFVTGISLQGPGCASCEITIQNVLVSAGHEEIGPGIREIGIAINVTKGTLRVNTASIETSGGGRVIVAEPWTTFEGGSIGIDVQGEDAFFSATGVTISARSASAAPGIAAGWFGSYGPRALTIRNATLAGHYEGVHVRDGAVMISGARIKCENGGIKVLSNEILVENVKVEGCRNVGLDLETYYRPGSPIMSLANFSVTNSSIGVRFAAGGDTEPLQPMPTIANGVVHSNRKVGILVGTSVALSNIEVSNNGSGWPGNGTNATSWGGIIVANGSVTVTGSSFEGNTPYAVAIRTNWAEAYGNWWGDERGPTIRPSVGTQPLLALGDPVHERVEFVPFLPEFLAV